MAHHLKWLKLPTFLRDYPSVAAPCSQERSSYPQYPLHLADRERRATKRNIREAAFPVLKTIETFDFTAQLSINEPLVRELLRGEYMAKRENVLLVGNPGTGKTHWRRRWASRLHARQARALREHDRPGDTDVRSEAGLLAQGRASGASGCQRTIKLAVTVEWWPVLKGCSKWRRTWWATTTPQLKAHGDWLRRLARQSIIDPLEWLDQPSPVSSS